MKGLGIFRGLPLSFRKGERRAISVVYPQSRYSPVGVERVPIQIQLYLLIITFFTLAFFIIEDFKIICYNPINRPSFNML